MVFNDKTRTENSIMSSAAGTISTVLKILLGFGYRTVFVLVLSEVYLGINGLFSSILLLLSLADLGIATAIVYRFYEPISKGDVQKVGMIMNYFRRVYAIIALVITVAGLAITPFIKLLINDPGEIPSDVNLYVVYLLFLANTVSSYLFSYKMSLLSADQKSYINSIIDLILTVAKYGLQIIVLIITRDFTATLAASIFTIIAVNIAGSIYTTKKYKEVFAVKEMLPKEERKQILHDTRACLYHKVGSVIVGATDNSILTKMISLGATGLYSNYSMIIGYVTGLLGQILGNYTGSVGNAIQLMSEDDYFLLFKKIQFAGLWISSVVTVCTYICIDDLLYVWLGENYIFGGITTVIICFQMYLHITRLTNGAFSNVAGLFVKDRVRPLIEAGLNLVISIILTKYLGIAGVFLGTIISSMLTSWWREPYLIFKYSLKRSVKEYWKTYGLFTLLTAIFFAGIKLLRVYVFTYTPTWVLLFVEAIVVFAFMNFIYWLLFRKRMEFVYFVEVTKRITGQLKAKIKKK